ncbi:site-specific integrase [Salegentibacter sp. LM13S]|uniref:tyrosine-type recombinase/integrase n=1 Tax=Salegentibacter lacus TaxID=2873599 RepID=UPI001CCE73A1|nr:phage integrase SAM-like domain-containing protein [Salegentibacter lacus]MBZ9632604.1 site-specific integrase [Salegentibacter lacus]
MATTKFRVRKSTTGTNGNIQLEFNYGKGNRFRYGTGLQIQNVKNWDANKMRIKNVIGEKFKIHINNELNKLQTGIEEFYTTKTITEKQILDNSTLREYCDIFFNKIENHDEKNQTVPFLKFYKWYIEHHKTHPLPTTGEPLSPGTARTYNNAFNLINRFNDEVYKVDYHNITLEFYDNYIQWTQEQDYSTNYIGTHIKILKTILNSATERGYNTNLDFRKKYFRKPSEQINNIFLNQSEINSIYKADLSSFRGKIENGVRITRDMLEKARDLFLVGCATGLRVSDFNNLNESHLFTDTDDTMFFRLSMKKGKRPITIPINSMVKQILSKNNGNPPSSIPNQHINYSIKIIGKIAGITELTTKTTTQGGIKRDSTEPKYKFISNHTARRSFCTNGYLAGIPTADIMAISGHRQERTFYNYIKVNDLQRAKKIGKHKFFS